MDTNLSDKVRAFARAKYVIPQLESGNGRFCIRVKDVWNDLQKEGFSVTGRTPLICKALTGPKFLLENGLEKERVDGPPSETSPTVVVHYRIASAQGARLGVFNSDDAILPIVETPEEWAHRMTGKLFGLMKEELSSFGGGEAFLKWVRSEDEDEAA